MLGAIRLAGKRSGAAEVKILVVRVSMGPQAARPVEFEEIPLRRSDRCGDARRQSNAVQLADHRVLGQPQPTADLGSRQPLLEKLSQPLDALRRPGNDIHMFPLYSVDPPVHPTRYVPPLCRVAKQYLNLVSSLLRSCAGS